jgi:hypothetical protein
MVSAPNQLRSLRTYCPGQRRIRDLAYSALCLLLVSGANALAQVEDKAAAPTNAMLGRWLLFAKNCREPDLIFEAKSATFVIDADGTIQRQRFRKVEYAASQPNEITVNFNEPHGLGKLHGQDCCEKPPLRSHVDQMSVEKRFHLPGPESRISAGVFRLLSSWAS